MTINISVLLSPSARQVREWQLSLPQGTTVGAALTQVEGLPALLEAAGLPSDVNHCRLGLWGRAVVPGKPLRAGDRIEIYRPLTVDPKVARRERFQKQGRRSAGLFARQKAKPGPV